MRAMEGKPWSDDELAKLKDMWLEGASAAKIARALPGRTRCAVLGKVHRIKGIPKRVTTIARSRAQRGIPAPRKVTVPPENIIPASQLKPADPPIFTRDLEDKHCRFPYDDPQAPDRGGYRYCGRDKSGASRYCDSHNVVVHQQQNRKVLDDAG